MEERRARASAKMGEKLQWAVKNGDLVEVKKLVEQVRKLPLITS